ncbi:hypothetical protein [Runella sp.]|uniref:hypothetical protein n=1 Tax=Runella sp. TaxID=1960881 RepID=UPI003D11CD37
MTLAQLLALLAENPDLANQFFSSAEVTAHFAKDGRVLKTQADIDKAIADAQKLGDGEAVKRINEAWGKVFSDQLGVQKPNGVKEIDFFPDEIKKRLTVQTDPKNQTDKDLLDTRIKTLEDDLKKEREANANKEKTLFERTKKATVDAHINSLNIAIPAHLKTNEEIEAYRQAQRNLVRASLLGMKAEETTDGLLAFYGEDGKALADAAGKPLGVDAITKQFYGPLLAPSSHQQGGTGGNPQGGSGGKYSVPFAEFQKALAAQGIAQGSEEFNKEFAEYEKVNPTLQ